MVINDMTKELEALEIPQRGRVDLSVLVLMREPKESDFLLLKTGCLRKPILVCFWYTLSP